MHFRTVAAGACDFEKMLALLHKPASLSHPVSVSSLAAELVYHSLCEADTPHLLDVAQVNIITILIWGLLGFVMRVLCFFVCLSHVPFL